MVPRDGGRRQFFCVCEVCEVCVCLLCGFFIFWLFFFFFFFFFFFVFFFFFFKFVFFFKQNFFCFFFFFSLRSVTWSDITQLPLIFPTNPSPRMSKPHTWVDWVHFCVGNPFPKPKFCRIAPV